MKFIIEILDPTYSELLIDAGGKIVNISQEGVSVKTIHLEHWGNEELANVIVNGINTIMNKEAK